MIPINIKAVKLEIYKNIIIELDDKFNNIKSKLNKFFKQNNVGNISWWEGTLAKKSYNFSIKDNLLICVNNNNKYRIEINILNHEGVLDIPAYLMIENSDEWIYIDEFVSLLKMTYISKKNDYIESYELSNCDMMYNSFGLHIIVNK